jgi:hypothetical protein
LTCLIFELFLLMTHATMTQMRSTTHTPAMMPMSMPVLSELPPDEAAGGGGAGVGEGGGEGGMGGEGGGGEGGAKMSVVVVTTGETAVTVTLSELLRVVGVLEVSVVVIAVAAVGVGATTLVATLTLAAVTTSVMSSFVMPLPRSATRASLKALWSKESTVPATVKLVVTTSLYSAPGGAG